MKFAFIAAKQVAFPVVVMCQVLGVSRSGYYASANRPPSARSKADGELAEEIVAAHRRSRRRYGSPRVHRALRKKASASEESAWMGLIRFRRHLTRGGYDGTDGEGRATPAGTA